ncbi:MAG: hypothetical protein K0R66_1589 [Gammaproteobacteria bacterium]|jgi:hypothetical protein|nr:hypothetical protein [Gammaproteobacteria bacterium]
MSYGQGQGSAAASINALSTLSSLVTEGYVLSEHSTFHSASKVISICPPGSRIYVKKSASFEALPAISKMPEWSTLRLAPDIAESLAIAAVSYLPQNTILLIDKDLPAPIAKSVVANMPAFTILGISNNIDFGLAVGLVGKLPPATFFMIPTHLTETQVKALVACLPEHAIILIHKALSSQIAMAAVTSLKPGMTVFLATNQQETAQAVTHYLPEKGKLWLKDHTAPAIAAEAIKLMRPGCKLLIHKKMPKELVSTIRYLPAGCEVVIPHRLPVDLIIEALSHLPRGAAYRCNYRIALSDIPAIMSRMNKGSHLLLTSDMPIHENLAIIFAYVSNLPEACILDFDPEFPQEYIPVIRAKLHSGSPSTVSPETSPSLSASSQAASSESSGGAAASSSSAGHSETKLSNYPHRFTAPGDLILVQPDMTEADIKKALDEAGPAIRLEFAAGVSIELAIYAVKNLPQHGALVISENNSPELAKAAASNLSKGRCLHCRSNTPKLVLEAAVSNLAAGCKLLLHTYIGQYAAKIMAECLPPGCILTLSDSTIGGQSKEYIKEIISSLKAGCIVYIAPSLFEEYILKLIEKHLAKGCKLIDGRIGFNDSEDDSDKLKAGQASEEPLFTSSSLSIFETLRTAACIEDYYSDKLRTEAKYPRFALSAMASVESAILSSKRLYNRSSLFILNRFIQENVAMSAASNLPSASFLAFSPNFSKDPDLIKKICQNTKKVYLLENTPEDLATLIASCLAPGCSLSFHPHLSAYTIGITAANLAKNCSVLLDNNLYRDQAQACAYNLSTGSSIHFAIGTSKVIIQMAASGLKPGCKLVLNFSIPNEVAARAVEFLSKGCILTLTRSMLNDNPEQQIKAIIPHLGFGAILHIEQDFPDHLAEIAIACLSELSPLQDDRPKPAASAAAFSSPAKMTGRKRPIAEITPSH